MIETSARVLLVVAVAVLFVTPAVAMALPESEASEPTEAPDDAQIENETIQPGEQLSGVVSVQGAEVDNAVESRSFGREVAAASTNESKAAVVVDRVERLEARLAELQAQREELQTAYENGTLPGGAYQARMASLATRIDGVERQLNHSQRVTATLPEQARQAAGLNETKIGDLRSRAGEMRGGEVAAAARSVGGPGVGRGMPDSPGGGPPDGIPRGPNDPGPPGDAGPGGNGGPPGDAGAGGNGGPPGDGNDGPNNDSDRGGPNDAAPGNGGPADDAQSSDAEDGDNDDSETDDQSAEQ